MADLAKISKKSIYCQVKFLESICDNNRLPTISDSNIDFFEIVRDSIIYFDKSEEVIKGFENSNPYVARLIKMDVNGECNIEWQDDDLKLEDYVKDYEATDGIYDYSPILFVYQVKKQRRSNNNLCQKYRSLYGLMIFDQESYFDIRVAFEDSGVAVRKKSTEDWGELLGTKTIYGNSLVIIDDYLLDNTGLYGNNLHKILDVLLPWDIKIPFYLTFISRNCNTDYSSRYKIIKKIIAELRPKYFKDESIFNGLIRINIIEDCSNVFHDRVILTNYCWISCGNGFDLFNGCQKAKHSTNVSILYPFIQRHVKWVKECYLNFLCDSREVFSDAKKGNNKWYEGALFENRLLMMNTITEYLDL